MASRTHGLSWIGTKPLMTQFFRPGSYNTKSVPLSEKNIYFSDVFLFTERSCRLYLNLNILLLRIGI